MKNVLCYGDSNTHGYDGVTGGRFPWGVRWTSLVQEALKEEQVRIIEEGQNGRTTVWDDPIEGMKSGLKYLIPCLESHSPLDVVVLMLGTNDIKQRFSLSASDVAAGAETLVKTIKMYFRENREPVPEILLVSPLKYGGNRGPQILPHVRRRAGSEDSPESWPDITGRQRSGRAAPFWMRRL